MKPDPALRRSSGARRRPTGTESRRHALATAVPALILVLTCARGGRFEPPPNEVLVVGLEKAPIHLDPRVGTDTSSGRVFEIMLNGLVTKNPDGSLRPDLAESWEILDEGRRYRFKLRPGVRFHDGGELDAADVVATFQPILDTTLISPKRGSLQQLERVEMVDRLTVDFVLNEPFGALLVNLTSFLGIIPQGSESEEFNRRPVGTGPFRLVERRPDRLVFEGYEGYWEGPPRLEKLILREIPDATVRALELEKGAVHLVASALPPDIFDRFRGDPAFRTLVDPAAKYAYLGLNLEDPALARIQVRRALAHAIDRSRLVDSLWRGLGTVTETLLPPGHWARHPDLKPIAYDPHLARSLLDRAGYPDPDGDGPQPRLRLTYKTSTDETALLQAQIIQAMLAEVGVAIDIRSFEFATFYSDIKTGSFQLFSLMWTGVVDPDIYRLILHSESVPPAGANRGRYRNPEFDRLIELGAALAAPADRRPFYLAAQEILARDLPYISLFNGSNYAVMRAEVEGYRNYPSGEYYSLRSVSWSR